jgi:hypothetical protein
VSAVEILVVAPKTEQIQIRVTPQQKAALKRHARRAGLDVSAWVLARALPQEGDRFRLAIDTLRGPVDSRYALAELNDVLDDCPPYAFADMVAAADLRGLSPLLQNYVAAMVERAAALKGIDAPAWVSLVEPLASPHFVTPLKSLRLHLLRSSPVPFKRRNIFIDASIGDRV